LFASKKRRALFFRFAAVTRSVPRFSLPSPGWSIAWPTGLVSRPRRWPVAWSTWRRTGLSKQSSTIAQFAIGRAA